MRGALVLIAGFASTAHAQGADPRDVFGLRPKKQAAPLDCSDGSAFGCAGATDPIADEVPFALRTWLPASYLLSLPTADGAQTDVASYALAASGDPNGGVSFGGASGLENRWTIDGAPADGARTGGADTRVPLVFLDGLYVTAGGFAARDRTSTGGTVDARLIRGTKHHEIDARLWLGATADPRLRPTLPATYDVRTGVVKPGPFATLSLVATGPLVGDWWYAAGIAPSLSRTHFTFKAATLVDANNDMLPDGLPGVVTTDLVERDARKATTYEVPVLLRTGWDRGPHHLELSLVGSVFDDTRYLYNATLQSAGVDGTSIVGDAIATWKSTWHDTHLRVQAAWHRAQRRESAHDAAAANMPQQLSAYVPNPLPDDPALGGACSDMGNDPFPNITNCPIPIGWFASGGAGPLVDATADRPSITADLAHRFGNNVVRAGATGEDTRLVTTTRFTGGEQIRSLFPGFVDERKFLDPNTACSETGACPTADSSTLSYRTRYTAAYVEDTFQPASNIQVDGGLRWELMWVGSALHFSNQLAPRLGASWDPLGNGRSRIWTSMGRSYALLPAGLGYDVLRRDRYVDNITSPFGTSRSIQTGQAFAVAGDLLPIAEDELTAGAEVALLQSVRATAWAQGRWLHSALAVTPDGLDNPGRDLTTPASRNSALGGVELWTNPMSKLALRVGYMVGQTVGSWTGVTTADFEFTSANLAGPLPTSIGQRTYIEAERGGQVGPVKLAFAMRLSLASGRPRSALSETEDGFIYYLLPRASLGRGPMLTQTNVRVAATYRGVDVVLDVFNLFDRRDATSLDEVYASGSIDPIVNGKPSDLVFLRTESGNPAVRNAGFQVPVAYQAPLSAVLGVRSRF